jgi:hypothetical protein
MTFQEHIQEKIYKGQPGKFEIPVTLYHENLIEGDMIAKYSQWEDINEILPLRPKGNFFWGPEMSQGCRISVKVSELDPAKLFVFPSVLAQKADELVVVFQYRDRRSQEELEEMEALKRVLQKCQAVPFSEYHGQFAPEYIYTEDIPAEKLSNEETP